MTRSPEAAAMAREASGDLRLGEVVAALTYALDLTEGQPEGHALRVAVIGMAIGERLGLGPWERSDLYYALLLKDLGCSSNAARLAATFGADDLEVKHAFKLVDLGELRDGLPFVLRHAGRAAGPLQRVRHILDVSLGRGGGQQELMRIRCERGADIARELGFREATYEAIRALDEHWDGGGHPYGLEGEAIPLFARILLLAQTAEVFWAAHGPESAAATIAARRGRWFDPRVVDAFLELQAEGDLWEVLADEDGLAERVAALEPAELTLRADEAMLDRVASAFARVIDAKSPWTALHSERVRAFALGIAERLGLDDERRRLLSRAALLHDIGKLGVPNTILDKPGRLDDEEVARIRRHPADSERILARVGPFRAFAELAAAHHERLDGSGYHRGRRGDELSLEARILATADPFEALTADRPYRDGLSAEEAIELLRRDAGTALDGDCVEALAAFVASDDGRRLLGEGRRQA
jgi:HD-GYP domain-containing protein (c-di-GMP phosphodiesterase class II)